MENMVCAHGWDFLETKPKFIVLSVESIQKTAVSFSSKKISDVTIV